MENDRSSSEITKWTGIVANRPDGRERLRAHLCGLALGSLFGVLVEDYYAQEGLTRFRDWALEVLAA